LLGQLVERVLFGFGEPLPAVLGGPGDAREPGVVQGSLETARLRQVGDVFAGGVLGQPGGGAGGEVVGHRPSPGRSARTTVAAEAKMPPTPWTTLISTPSTCRYASPRSCRTDSWIANIPYMPVWVSEVPHEHRTRCALPGGRGG